jgi:hypothetical protein
MGVRNPYFEERPEPLRLGQQLHEISVVDTSSPPLPGIIDQGSSRSTVAPGTVNLRVVPYTSTVITQMPSTQALLTPGCRDAGLSQPLRSLVLPSPAFPCFPGVAAPRR